MTKPDKRERAAELVQYITNYLSNGGLWNPEQMEHNKVRELLIECREALATQPGPDLCDRDATCILTKTHEEKCEFTRTPPVEMKRLAEQITGYLVDEIHRGVSIDERISIFNTTPWPERQTDIEKLLAAAFAASNQQLKELEGIDKMCDAANEHVLLLQKDVDCLTAQLTPSPCGVAGHCMKDFVEQGRKVLPPDGGVTLGGVKVTGYCHLCRELEEERK